MTRFAGVLVSLALLGAACASDGDGQTAVDDPVTATTEVTATAAASGDADTDAPEDTASAGDDEDGAPLTFQIEVWADNWMAVSVDGELIGEDSVPITTERSFNAETFTFEAAYPFTVAIEAKDFKETDSGIEYIGEGNQQMGDGGLIAQVTDIATGEVVAVTSGDWATLVVHRAPLNKDCEKDADPDATCDFEITETPLDWVGADYDDSAWATATEWSAGEVGPKDGYDEIRWDDAARLIWGTDLEVDNTILFRTTVDD
ncbi:MAG: hypothetical protein DHS20C19_07680 [Acidimicrobiales bacterium]|nr:MAG: hypothetical protein DHS20C19_07680 [Acidimicrobiales bacterium]